MKIVIVNFSRPTPTESATLSSVSLYLGVVTVIMAKHPPRPHRVIGVAWTLNER